MIQKRLKEAIKALTLLNDRLFNLLRLILFIINSLRRDNKNNKL